MLILGHTGITLGAAALLSGALRRSRISQPKEESPQAVADSKNSSSEKASWFTMLWRRVDIRLLMIGALLPDIIDKPAGQFFFREPFSNGRIFSHTLLFLILVTVAGLYLYWRRGSSWLLALSFGTFAHLVLDRMWRAPQTLFWPVLGSAFARIELADWASNILQAMLTNPEVYIPELVGAIVLFWFGLVLVRRRKVFAFIRYGKVG